MTVRPDEPHILSYKAQSELWIDGDEFGTRRHENASHSASPAITNSPSSPRRGHRRSPSIVGAHSPRSRSRSPPPAPMVASPPPPVPPIPSFALASPGAKRSVLHTSPTHPQIRIPDLNPASRIALISPYKRTSGSRSTAP
ncbi:uncharacterized protein LAESUDRAFT_718798 [Laetiporus sulphureus 93-53]|uniref:Uncharacterized protein n=1 Tax=Laetiporus sulphureus 93-53 TaxID=1314785 RepID=A0A165I357_9APHY|nr:uncharacterized protein LAESUDRAFT_718798 [Laetiporus sulphureus 93-53]KZT12532.1 hypothetical protein LAESUDRAFT_718798 [Laetiporus sulphureus 93-53]